MKWVYKWDEVQSIAFVNSIFTYKQKTQKNTKNYPFLPLRSFFALPIKSTKTSQEPTCNWLAEAPSLRVWSQWKMAGFSLKGAGNNYPIGGTQPCFHTVTMQKTGEKVKRDEQFFISPLSPKLYSFLFLWSAATSTFGFSLATVSPVSDAGWIAMTNLRVSHPKHRASGRPSATMVPKKLFEKRCFYVLVGFGNFQWNSVEASKCVPLKTYGCGSTGSRTRFFSSACHNLPLAQSTFKAKTSLHTPRLDLQCKKKKVHRFLLLANACVDGTLVLRFISQCAWSSQLPQWTIIKDEILSGTFPWEWSVGYGFKLGHLLQPWQLCQTATRPWQLGTQNKQHLPFQHTKVVSIPHISHILLMCVSESAGVQHGVSRS